MVILFLMEWIMVINKTWHQYDIKIQVKDKEVKYVNILYDHKSWILKQYDTWILQQDWSMSSISSITIYSR